MNREYSGAGTRLPTLFGVAAFLWLVLVPGLVLVLVLVLIPGLTRPALAEGDRIPRFVSLQSGKVNMRIGPGEDYPIQWIYQRAGMPMEVIEEFDVWRRVRDHDGIIGWVRANLLSGKRTALVRDRRRALLTSPEDQAPATVLVDPGVILSLLECEKDWCRAEIQDFRGWLRKDALWGVYADELIGD